MKRLSAFAASIALVAAIPATARADVLWDLVHWSTAGGDLGATTVLTNPGNGTITAKTVGTGMDVYSKNFVAGCDAGISAACDGLFVNNGERGIGVTANRTICDPSQNCGTEIGFPNTTGGTTSASGSLFLDLTLVTSGVLNRIYLGSTQIGESYAVFGSLTGSGGIGNAWVPITACTGTGPGSTLPGGTAVHFEQFDCGVTVNWQYLRFDPAPGINENDYLVQALNFTSAVPEPGTMVLLATGLVALTGAGMVRRRHRK